MRFRVPRPGSFVDATRRATVALQRVLVAARCTVQSNEIFVSTPNAKGTRTCVSLCVERKWPMPSMTPPSHAFLKTSSTMMIPDGCNTKVSLASSGSFSAQWHDCVRACVPRISMEKKANWALPREAAQVTGCRLEGRPVVHFNHALQVGRELSLYVVSENAQVARPSAIEVLLARQRHLEPPQAREHPLVSLSAAPCG